MLRLTRRLTNYLRANTIREKGQKSTRASRNTTGLTDNTRSRVRASIGLNSRPNEKSSRPRRAAARWGEADGEHHDGKSNMQVGVRRIVRHQSHDRSRVAGDKSEHSDERVNNSEDLEEHARRAGAGHSAEQKNCSRSQVHDIVGKVDVKDAEQHRHAIDNVSRGWDEPQNSDDQEDQTKKKSKCFSHNYDFVELDQQPAILTGPPSLGKKSIVPLQIPGLKSLRRDDTLKG